MLIFWFQIAIAAHANNSTDIPAEFQKLRIE